MPGMKVGIVGVVMGVVSLRVMVSTAVALVVVVMAVVLVCMRRGLQVLVRVHVMVGALLLPR